MFPEPTAHNVLHVHSGSGKKGLYIGNPLHATFQVKKEFIDDAEFSGKSDEEIAAYMEEVKKTCMEVIERPSCFYSHKWQPNQVLIWDNTAGMHRSMGGYGDNPRTAIRGMGLMFQPAA